MKRVTTVCTLALLIAGGTFFGQAQDNPIRLIEDAGASGAAAVQEGLVADRRLSGRRKSITPAPRRWRRTKCA